jgi:hypothetical protein
MNAFRHFLLRTATAMLLACAGASAMAAPLHYVNIDTTTLKGRSGYLDFLFLGLGDAAPAEARVSQLAGDFSGDGFALGSASGSAAAGLALDNSSFWNEAGLWAHFGGVLRFAVEFDLAAGPDTGTTLSVALLDADLNYAQGTSGDVVRFALQPGQPVDVYADTAFARVGDQPLPEAPTLWLLGAGMLLMATRARRR